MLIPELRTEYPTKPGRRIHARIKINVNPLKPRRGRERDRKK
jgi:hypothetical protein